MIVFLKPGSIDPKTIQGDTGYLVGAIHELLGLLKTICYTAHIQETNQAFRFSSLAVSPPMVSLFQ